MTTWTPPDEFYTAAHEATGRTLFVAPNGRGHTDAFVHDMLDRPPAGTPEQPGPFCILLNNATDTKRCQRLLTASAAVCFVRGRVKFTDAYGEPAKPIQGQMVCGVGVDVARFTRAFGPLGVVLTKLRRPPAHVMPQGATSTSRTDYRQ